MSVFISCIKLTPITTLSSHVSPGTFFPLRRFGQTRRRTTTPTDTFQRITSFIDSLSSYLIILNRSVFPDRSIFLSYP